jgi:YtcA family
VSGFPATLVPLYTKLYRIAQFLRWPRAYKGTFNSSDGARAANLIMKPRRTHVLSSYVNFVVEPPVTRLDIKPSRTALLVVLASLSGCDGAPSRNILGSYFPTWMVCALAGVLVALIARVFLKSTGILEELPARFVVILAIGCAATLSLWLLWLA